jgi:hypothetical protein
LAACIHEPRVLRLRSDSTPWPLGQPFEVHVPADELRAIRVELATRASLRFTCSAPGAEAEMSIYGGANEALARGPCGELVLRDLQPGSYFLVGRVKNRPADLVLSAEQRP